MSVLGVNSQIPSESDPPPPSVARRSARGRPAGPLPEFTDEESARLLIARQGGDASPHADARFTAEWLEGLTLVEQDPRSGIDDWLAAVEQRDPARGEQIRAALDAASRQPAPNPAPQPAAGPTSLPPGTPVKALDQGNFGEVVKDFGDEVDVHFVSPAGAERTVRLARSKLRRPDGSPLDPVGEPARPFELAILGTRDFIHADYRREWLIKRIAVRGRPGVIGGPQKSMKTSITVDLMISLASANRFLDEFDVPRPTKTLLISGESGAAVVQETCRRICRAKGLDPVEMERYAYWGFDLPRLDSPDQLAALAEFIRISEIEVVILDPLYLCLLTGGHSIDPANLFDVGPLLKTITATCLEAGATPFLVHHFRKNRETPLGPPELEDLSFAGIQEFARQWLLVNRRERYEPGSGRHHLWFSVGGSDGHSGEWAVDIDEGIVDEDLRRDRDWRVTIHGASRVRDEARQRAEASKAAKAAEKEQAKHEAVQRSFHDNVERALDKLRKESDGLTRSKWKELLGINGTKMASIVSTLLEQRRIAECQMRTLGGDGKYRNAEGYRFVTSNLDQATQDNSGQPRTTPDDYDFSAAGPGLGQPRTGTPDTPPLIGGVRGPSEVDRPDLPTPDEMSGVAKGVA